MSDEKRYKKLRGYDHYLIKGTLNKGRCKPVVLEEYVPDRGDVICVSLPPASATNNARYVTWDTGRRCINLNPTVDLWFKRLDHQGGKIVSSPASIDALGIWYFRFDLFNGYHGGTRYAYMYRTLDDASSYNADDTLSEPIAMQVVLPAPAESK